jgi:type II secretory pathway component GspD/PulD (secretin)
MRPFLICLTLCLLLGVDARAESLETGVFKLAHLQASRAESIYRLFIVPGPEAKIVAQDDDNTLVIRDEADRLKRFRSTLKRMDRKGSLTLGIFMRPVRYANPRTLAKQLAEILIDRFHHPLRLVPDIGGARILIMTTHPQYAVLHRLAQRLDRPEKSRRGLP